MYNFYKDITSSDRIIVAQQVKNSDKAAKYTLKKITEPSIPNKTLALSIGYSGVPVSWKQVKADVSQYNDYVAFLDTLPGFVSLFVENDLMISKEKALTVWSEETVAKIFSLKHYYFETPLHIYHDVLYDCDCVSTYNASIAGQEMVLPIGENSSSYPDMLNGKKCIWNWVDDGHDFTYFLWTLLGERFCQDDENTDDDQVTYGFDCYETFRHDGSVEIQLIQIFEKLEKLGYLESFTIKPEASDIRWHHFGKSDCSIDLALIDESFKKNKLLMQQIELLLWAQPEELQRKYYFLTAKDGKQYLAYEPGKFGGNCKLKIYGRLDCPSANSHIQKGEYVKHRVFFADEETAVAAGYRPCAKCMPEAYKKWKKQLVEYSWGY